MSRAPNTRPAARTATMGTRSHAGDRRGRGARRPVTTHRLAHERPRCVTPPRDAIVGGARPPNQDNSAAYPTAILTKIWQDVEAYSPRPAFALTTGDYTFASPRGNQAVPQTDLYVNARSAFSNVVFPAMGVHECDGAMADNCAACGSVCSGIEGTCF